RPEIVRHDVDEGLDFLVLAGKHSVRDRQFGSALLDTQLQFVMGLMKRLFRMLSFGSDGPQRERGYRRYRTHCTTGGGGKDDQAEHISKPFSGSGGVLGML